MGRCYRPAFLYAVLLCLPACSPPPQRLIEECRETAIHEGFGHQLNSDDIGELTEVCMASKGFALREIGKRCTADMPTAISPECYYRDNLFGRMSKVFW
jgi:hypothetical protein